MTKLHTVLYCNYIIVVYLILLLLHTFNKLFLVFVSIYQLFVSLISFTFLIETTQIKKVDQKLLVEKIPNFLRNRFSGFLYKKKYV